MVRILSVLLLAVFVVAAFAGFRVFETNVRAEVYRTRLLELSRDHDALRGLYDQAVRRTAVTELVVAGDSLAVVVRTAEGDVEEIETPFDPRREIYVDYVVRDGRLWIRRLFDDRTPPGDGMLIDPELFAIDWESINAGHGKAAYRALADGRWIVDVSGDGSLGLRRRTAGEVVALVSAPPVRDYAPIEEEVQDALAAISPAEAVAAIARQLEAAVARR